MPSCDFQTMEVPTFDAFCRSYVVPVGNRALCEAYFNALGDDDRKRAVFYVRYLEVFSNERNLPFLPASMWLVTRWWSTIPALIKQRMENPVRSPSIQWSADAAEMEAR